MYKLKFSIKAEKQFDKLDKFIKKRIIKYLEEKAIINPTSYGRPLSANLSGFWKYRIEGYRIIIKIKNEEFIVFVVDIDRRDKIYKNQ